jgi:hypothetical protein
MRGLKTIPSASLFMDGWTVHYSFFRTHDTPGETPAEETGIVWPSKNWIDAHRQTEKPRAYRLDVSEGIHDFRRARRHVGRRHARRRKRRAGVPALSRLKG